MSDKRISLKKVLDAIAAEQELPGGMPDKMWAALRDDRDACTKSHQLAVAATKTGIRDRILALATAPAKRKPAPPRVFKWIVSHRDLHGAPAEFQLLSPAGKSAASVWKNGTWHTWDRHGVGGENSTCRFLYRALDEAFRATIVQGFHGWGTLAPFTDDICKAWNESLDAESAARKAAKA